MQKIIINADDLGLSHVVNEAIESAIEKGVVTSSTIMAGGEAFEEAINIALRHPECSFGAHLTLDELYPLSDPLMFMDKGLVDKDGRFVRGAYNSCTFDKDVLSSVKNEWRAQIQKILDAGVKVSHLDSHHHCHTKQELFGVLVEISKEFNIDTVRLKHEKTTYIRRYATSTKSSSVPSAPTTTKGKERSAFAKLISPIKQLLYVRKLKNTFKTTDFFCSANFFMANKDILAQYDTIEIMCHPGHPSYQTEYDELSSFDFNPYKLINYDNLS